MRVPRRANRRAGDHEVIAIGRSDEVDRDRDRDRDLDLDLDLDLGLGLRRLA